MPTKTGVPVTETVVPVGAPRLNEGGKPFTPQVSVPPAPPVAVSVPLYGVLTVPDGRDELSTAGPMIMVCETLAGALFAFPAWQELGGSGTGTVADVPERSISSEHSMRPSEWKAPRQGRPKPFSARRRRCP